MAWLTVILYRPVCLSSVFNEVALHECEVVSGGGSGHRWHDCRHGGWARRRELPGRAVERGATAAGGARVGRRGIGGPASRADRQQGHGLVGLAGARPTDWGGFWAR